MEIDQSDSSQGENDSQEVDQTKIDIPTETSEICEGAKITAQRQTSEIREVENHDKVVIQLLTSEIPASAKKAKSLSSACIYKVPKVLRKLNKSAYTPRLIAIGPLHRNDEHLQTPMQHVKMSYMNNLLCRMTQGMENQEAEQKKILQDCMAAMKASLDDAKECYAEEVTLDEKMMLIDGCFILEFLYRLYLLRNRPKEFAQMRGEDPIFVNYSTVVAIQEDLVLLENQIPFLVLEKLYPLTLAQVHNNMSLNNFVVVPLVHQLMRPTAGNSTNSGSAETSCWPRGCCILRVSKTEEKVPSEDEAEEQVSSGNAKRYHHILHKIHDDYLPRDQTGKEDAAEKETGKEDAAKKETGKEELIQTIPCASELVYAGVKFERSTANDLFKVKFIEPKGPFSWFRSARFEIPPLEVDDGIELFLRNFIAFEQCCPGISQHFTSFAHLMDMLVNSDIDVQVLEKAEVVNNLLGASKDVTDLFNNIVKEVIGEEPLYADTCNRATKYRKLFWPKNMAYLKAQYFASPWKFIAFCLGLVYFVITIIEFIISVTPSVLNWLVMFGFQYNF